MMRTFIEWMKESNLKERLESAVREYMSTKPEAKKCYYITRPKNIHFDPSNPKHVEDELGSDYDRNIDVVPFKHHPLSFTCANVADGLAQFLKNKGFKARKVAGWYGHAEPGYYAGYEVGLDDPTPPKGIGRNPQQHWWVEAEGYYIDITSAQFHPTNPKDQKDMVIRDKNNSFYDGSYIPVRRFHLGRKAKLPPNVRKMIEKILSLKKFSKGHSSIRSDNHNLATWIERNAPRYTMSLARVHDVVAALKAHTRPGFHFADKKAMEMLFGEAFDDMDEESGEDNQSDFKPKETNTSRGTVRVSPAFSRISLSSTNKEELDNNFAKLKELIIARLPDAALENENSYSEEGAYGRTVHHISANMKEAGRITMSPGIIKDLRREGFRFGN